MNIRLNDGSIRTTAGFAAHLSARLSAALDRFADRVDDVIVSIRDVNGQRHGPADHRCVIAATVRGVGPVRVEHRADSFYGATDHAIGKLKRAVAHRVDRTRKK